MVSIVENQVDAINKRSKVGRVDSADISELQKLAETYMTLAGNTRKRQAYKAIYTKTEDLEKYAADEEGKS